MSTKKVKVVIALLQERGWIYERTKGSHRVFVNKETRKSVVVSGKISDEMPIGTFKAILKETGLKESDFFED